MKLGFRYTYTYVNPHRNQCPAAPTPTLSTQTSFQHPSIILLLEDVDRVNVDRVNVDRVNVNRGCLRITLDIEF